MMSAIPGRRASDHDIDPAVEARIQEVVRETRHELRNDIAVLATAQAQAQLQATKEHGEVRTEIQGVRADVAAARRDIADLLPMREQVAELKRHDDIGDARDEAISGLRRDQRNQTRWLAALIVAAVPSVAVIVHWLG